MRQICAILLLLLFACGKDDPKAPEAATLLFPERNSECTTGEDVTSTTSRVEFRWQVSAHTVGYDLEVRNLITNTPEINSTFNNAIAVTLLKGVPYSWRVISKSNETSETATSDTWLFYNAGSQSTYPPFPAQIISPSSGATIQLNGMGEATLSWVGSDVDNDIDTFEVFLDTLSPPVAIKNNLGFTENELSVSLDSDTVYFWRIITTDREGNTSDSGIFSFRTQ